MALKWVFVINSIYKAKRFPVFIYVLTAANVQFNTYYLCKIRPWYSVTIFYAKVYHVRDSWGNKRQGLITLFFPVINFLFNLWTTPGYRCKNIELEIATVQSEFIWADSTAKSEWAKFIPDLIDLSQKNLILVDRFCIRLIGSF